MFWRIELDKAGAILSCDPVADKGKNGGHVIFIEAETKVQACSFAKSWYCHRMDREAASKRRRVETRRAKALCVQCGQRQPDPGLATCEPCRDKKRAMRLKRDRESRVGVLAPIQALDNRRITGRYQGLFKIDMRRVLQRFDELGAPAFREWLAKEIADRQLKGESIKQSMHKPSPGTERPTVKREPTRGRPRTGSLVLTKSGWSARVHVRRNGVWVREQIQLNTLDKDRAQQKLDAMMRYQPIAEAAE